MVATYPNLATLQSIGKTAENRDIWLIKVFRNRKTKDKCQSNEIEYCFVSFLITIAYK